MVHIPPDLRRRKPVTFATLRRRLLSFVLLLPFSVFLLLSATPSPACRRVLPQLPPPPPVCFTVAGKIANNSLCCDRTDPRSDVCVMAGNVRALGGGRGGDIFLVGPPGSGGAQERIRPYTRKWESAVMSTIDELRLWVVEDGDDRPGSAPACDVRHDVPAVVFSTGGYTGNVYHEFNDGIIPLYITASHLRRKVVFVILEYHDWWMTKYEHIVARLSDYPPIDLASDRRTHCFPEVTVGLHIHDELTVDPARTPLGNTIADFRWLLDDAFRPRVVDIVQEEAARLPPLKKRPGRMKKPRLVIVSRNGSRSIENEAELAGAARAAGFSVGVLRPRRDTELARIYRALNSSDVAVGVHGAALTHLLFMRPGATLVQIVPLGADWAAEKYYGEPAAKLGLRYVAYKIEPRESSLAAELGEDDPVVREPDAVNAKGWETTKKVYLDRQRVRIDVARFMAALGDTRRQWPATRKKMTRKEKEPLER